MKRLRLIIPVLLVVITGSLWLMVDAQAAKIDQQPTSGCTFTGASATLALYQSPLPEAVQLLDTLPGGIAYPVVARLTRDFLIEVDATRTGWVSGLSGRLDGDCDSVLLDTTPFADFPVCMFTQHEDNRTFPAIFQNGTQYHLRVDHAFSFWAAADEGTMSGSCDLLPHRPTSPRAQTLSAVTVLSEPDVRYGTPVTQLEAETRISAGQLWAGIIDAATGEWGYWFNVRLQPRESAIGWVQADALAFGEPVGVLEPANLWAQHDVLAGEPLATISNVPVTVITGPQPAPPNSESNIMVDWYRVQVDESLSGWLIVDHLVFDFIPYPTRTAITDSETNLWSQPDIVTGEIVTSVSDGQMVQVLFGPRHGSIRRDTEDQGDWYQVRTDAGVIGWVWSGRLMFG